MDYWHEIVEHYGFNNSDGTRSKDHGTITPKTSVIILIYLAFGTDYPTGIAEYFSELRDREIEKLCPRVLTNSNKVASVLKQMAKDELVTFVNEVSVGAGCRKYYEINPQILQSPTRDSTTYAKRDGSPLIIPPETIAEFLGWMALENAGTADEMEEEQLRQERHKRMDGIFELWFRSETINYITFLLVIANESANQQPALSKLIFDYIQEIRSESLASDVSNESREEKIKSIAKYLDSYMGRV